MKNPFWLLSATILALTPSGASSHVKWFVNYDTTKEPVPVLTTLSAIDFWALLLLSIVVISITAVFDRKLRSPVDYPGWTVTLNRLHRTIPLVMRVGTSAFFLCLGIAFPNILLTPELISDNPWLRYIHIFIALTALHRRSCFIAGLGILFLYFYSVQLYGLFHMLDYFVFIGTAVYLVTHSFRAIGLHGLELDLLRFTLCYSFLWGAIEKFMQPGLFYDMLSLHPYLTMGLDHGFFIKACGFVEFCCAWQILTGRLAGYGGIGLMTFFVVGAIIPFGIRDFIGHFLFIVPMIAVLFTPRHKHIWSSAACSVLAFVSTFILFFMICYISYYILHYYLYPKFSFHFLS